jgi:hypothetical protein
MWRCNRNISEGRNKGYDDLINLLPKEEFEISKKFFDHREFKKDV